MTRIIEAFENLIHPDLVAKALKVTPEKLNTEILANGIDITQYIEKSNKEISAIDLNQDFNVVLAYKHKKLPKIIEPEFSARIYELINKDSQRILDFLHKVDDDKVEYYEYIRFLDKIQVYGKLLDFVCRPDLRKNTQSIKWDAEVNQFCKRIMPKLQSFHEKKYSLTYCDVVDGYILKTEGKDVVIPVTKSFFFILNDILKVDKSNLKNLIPYYLALRSHEDSEKITKIWLFFEILKTSFAKSLKKA